MGKGSEVKGVSRRETAPGGKCVLMRESEPHESNGYLEERIRTSRVFFRRELGPREQDITSLNLPRSKKWKKEPV